MNILSELFSRYSFHPDWLKPKGKIIKLIINVIKRWKYTFATHYNKVSCQLIKNTTIHRFYLHFFIFCSVLTIWGAISTTKNIQFGSPPPPLAYLMNILVTSTNYNNCSTTNGSILLWSSWTERLHRTKSVIKT